MATSIPESQRDTEPRRVPHADGSTTAAQVATLKGTFGLAFGITLIIIALVFAVQEQVTALALLLVGIPLAVWSVLSPKRSPEAPKTKRVG
jgi:sulfite exporter TauE/SafE